MKSFAVLDIETEGLDKFNDRITAIGVAYYELDPVGSFKLDQALPEPAGGILILSGDETGMLRALADHLADPVRSSSPVVAYNGWAFDLPYIRYRAMLRRVRLPRCLVDDSLLYDPHHYLNRSKTGKMSDVEMCVGFKRSAPEIDGKTAADLAKTGKKKDMDLVLAHLDDDIRSLAAVAARMFSVGIDFSVRW